MNMKRKLEIALATLLCVLSAVALLICVLLLTGKFKWKEDASEEPVMPESELLQETQEATPAPVSTQTPTPVPTEPPEISNRQPDLLTTGEEPSPLYATIWPIKDLDVYEDVSGQRVIGKVPACTMYCVLEENAEKNLFRIRLTKDSYGYISSKYCLINLPEYIGNLCAYNITNSFCSAYTIHEYEIPGITGTVIPGYESICLADGSYLVPFLYPSAQKLIVAANKALEQGYRIKIYDSYRPQIATQYIYDTAMAIVYQALPATTCTGREVSLPNPPVNKGRDYLMYIDLITMNGWDLGSFLAPGSSRHNMGVALDMTLESLETGEEIPAQTVMHDLSAFSTTRSNNEIANTILSIMQSAKMSTIISEWWHFQDNNAMNGLGLPYCKEGVSAKGWIADEKGERYRLTNGAIVKNGMISTDEGIFTLDSDGYLVNK